MIKISKSSIVGIVLAGFILGSGYWLVNSRPIQWWWATIAQGFNLQRSQQLQDRYESFSDKKLINTLWSGDFGKQAAASAVLTNRNKPELFDSFKPLLKSKYQDVRKIGRFLLDVDRARAIQVYIFELTRTDITESEHRQTLSLLVKLKSREVFPALYEYTRKDLNNQHGSSELMKRYGDPRGITALGEMLKNSPNISKYEKKRVEDTIQYLRSIPPSEHQASK